MEVGEDAPTADEVEAAAKKATSKKKTGSNKPKTAREAKVAEVQKQLDETTPEAIADKEIAAKDAAADLAVKVGEQQTKQEKIDAHFKENGITKDEGWAANMPGQYLAQQKHKAKEIEEEEESESESEEEEENNNDDDEDEEDDSDDDDETFQKKKVSKKGKKVVKAKKH